MEVVLVNNPKTIKVPNKLINNKWIVRMPSGSEVIIVPNYSNQQLVFNQTSEKAYDGDKRWIPLSKR